jgi:hypothetical protein
MAKHVTQARAIRREIRFLRSVVLLKVEPSSAAEDLVGVHGDIQRHCSSYIYYASLSAGQKRSAAVNPDLSVSTAVASQPPTSRRKFCA